MRRERRGEEGCGRPFCASDQHLRLSHVVVRSSAVIIVSLMIVRSV